MKKTIAFFLVLTWLLALGGSVFAQDDQNPAVKLLDDQAGWKRTGQAAMPILGRGMGARLMAMGDAGITLLGDASALFYNPAGIAGVEGRSAMFGNVNWLMDTQLYFGAVALNLGSFGVIGLSGLYYDYGEPIKATEIDATQEFGYRDIGEFTPAEYVFGLAYARRISDRFAVGGQIKYGRQDLLGGEIKTRIAYNTPDGWVQEEHDAATGAIIFDIGTVYNTGLRDLTLAMSLRNYGSEIKYEREAFDIPLMFSFGVSASVFKMLNKPSEDMDLLVLADYIHPRDWSERVNLGLEYSLKNMVYVRGGYKINYSSEGLCLGAGVKVPLPMGGVRIDYAFKDTGDTQFDAVHVYSLVIDF